MVAAVESVLVSGSTLSLTCSISPYNVDTPFIILSNWTTPEIRHDRINDDNESTKVQTLGANCSAYIVIDGWATKSCCQNLQQAHA